MQHVYRTIIIIIIKNKICTASSSCTSVWASPLRLPFLGEASAGPCGAVRGRGSPPLPSGLPLRPRCLASPPQSGRQLPPSPFSLKQCASLPFVREVKNAKHSDQSSPRTSEVEKLFVKVKNRILLFGGFCLFFVFCFFPRRGGLRGRGFWVEVNRASEPCAQQTGSSVCL